jgi:hypothetical protein
MSVTFSHRGDVHSPGKVEVCFPGGIVESIQLTVFFESPFWVAVVECHSQGTYRVLRRVFGAEPSDAVIHQFVLFELFQLQIQTEMKESTSRMSLYKNPKRLQREAQKAVQEKGIGTKAQMALQLELKHQKQENKICSRLNREADAKRRFALRQEKRKEKHKGH